MATILILEDSHERIEQFVEHFKHSRHGLIITDNVDQAIAMLSTRKIDLVYLDHDLGGKTNVDPTVEKTGYHVAKFIAEMATSRPGNVIIHSCNAPGAQSMADVLLNAKVVTYNAPFPTCLTQFKIK